MQHCSILFQRFHDVGRGRSMDFLLSQEGQTAVADIITLNVTPAPALQTTEQGLTLTMQFRQ